MAVTLVVNHPIWDRLEEEEHPPDPPADVPYCRVCGRKYAIALPRGGHTTRICGYCFREHLDRRKPRPTRRRPAPPGLNN